MVIRYRAYRPEGIVEAPTPEGLARVLKALGPIPASAHVHAPEVNPAGARSEAPTWHERILADEEDIDPIAAWQTFTSYVRGHQLDVLHVLKTAVRPMTTPDIMRAVKAPSPNAVAGYIAGGLFRNIRKAGLKNDDVIVTERWGGHQTYKEVPLLLANELPPKTR